ncbi:MAG: 16S rRNA (adenine(1518)-N(6)/adenine(1519)-N(6))-dimethyltransferase RsmA [Clostridia bacterium]|nr:16S rRNA (adenine(1518)-N(6)/adenine(1519)-N(6))-dimethyltransferase RsmA [Clostridia bacterium]
MDLTDITTVKRVLSRHGFTFSKSLGQNFITDPTVCPKMADLCGVSAGAGVIEIGPGCGVLTVELAKRAAKVVTIELDARLLPVLAETLDGCRNVEVVNADVLKTDLAALIEEHFAGMPVYVCANLPYYITSPVVMYLLQSRLPVENITVMVQKEAADRLCAKVGERDSGAVTVAVNYYATAEKLFGVGKGSFTPAPKVDSEVIRLTPRREPPVAIADEKRFFSVVRSAFSQRRKTAVNGLSSGLSLSKDRVAAALEAAGLPVSVRAETLSMEQLARLTDALFE